LAELVLDTWALTISQDCTHAKALQTLSLLEEIKQGHRITIDHGRTVLTQYFNNTSANSHAGQWLKLILSRSNKIFWRTGKLSNRHESELVNGLGFDRSDLVFVALASEAPDKLLVAEESDYTPEVKAYLSNQLGVAVLTIEEALAAARTLHQS
jgi:hypothetical protein